MIPFKKLLAYVAMLVFLLPWIIMATPCGLTLHVMLLVTTGLWQVMLAQVSVLNKSVI